MTFRGRLRLFFLTIVIVPMVGVALVLFLLIAESETGTADARIAGAMRVAFSLHSEAGARARHALSRAAADEALTAALAAGRRDAARARIASLARRSRTASIELRDPRGRRVAQVGPRAAVPAASAPLELPGGRRLGTLSVSTTTAASYARRLSRLTGLQIALFHGRSRLASTIGDLSEPPERSPKRSRVVEAGGRDYRARVETLSGGAGAPVTIVVLGEVGSLSGTAGGRRVLIAGILLGFTTLALCLSALLVRENARLHETVERQALTDERTGLPNLRALYAALDREIERSRRFGSPVGFVMLDIDAFSNVNKELGHQQGDKVLASVGRVLRETTRDVDVPARYGGEEFAVVLPGTDLDGGVQVAERMRAAIAALRVGRLDGGSAVRVTATFGVASVTVGADDKSRIMESLIAAADRGLLRAKRAGKNRVESSSRVDSHRAPVVERALEYLERPTTGA